MAAIRQASFVGGELAPTLHGRTDIDRYASGLRRCRNFTVTQHGTLRTRPGTRYVGRTRDDGPCRLAPFVVSDEESYLLEIGDRYLRVWYDGTPYALLTAPWSVADLPQLKWAQVGDVLTICHPNHHPRELVRKSHTQWELSEIRFGLQPRKGPALAAVAPPRGHTAEYRAREWEVVSTFVIVAPDGTLEETHWATAEEINDWTSRSFVGAYIDGPLAIYPDRPLRLGFRMVAGAYPEIVETRIYRGRNGVFGYVGRIEGAPSLDKYFIDEGDEPDYTRQPRKGTWPIVYRPPGGGSVLPDWPAAVAYFEGRLVLAGMVHRPSRLLFSAIDDFHNFDEQIPSRADLAIEIQLASRKRDQIRSVLGLDRLLAFTSSGVWSVGGAGGAPLSPTEVPEARLQLEIGSSWIEPLVVDGSVLFVRSSRTGVRDLLYSHEQRGYVGADLSILAEHLTAPLIREWAWARDPLGVVWLVRRDGKLLSLTYSRDEGIAAWAWHDTAGGFESVCSLPEGSSDSVYVVVRRMVNGRQRRYIERLDLSVSMDCAVRRFVREGDGAVEELDHLEGLDVMVVADGRVSGPHRVESGQLPRDVDAAPYYEAWVGLPFVADVELLDLAEARTRAKRVTRLTWEVEQSRGFWTGASWDLLTEWRQREVRDAWGTIPPASGPIEVSVQGGWDISGRACLRQVDPLPLSILAVTREVEAGG